MNYIKSLHIEGFKKFSFLDISFNPHTNILVGENEAGKSTILDAIKIVLNQTYRNADKSILRDLFNLEMIAAFQSNPSIATLPKILIEVELELDPKQANSSYFYGEVYGSRRSQPAKFGVRFECKYDEEIGSGMEQTILEGKIPYEYYTLIWSTFANRAYQVIKKPLGFVSIDTTSNAASSSFNYYNRSLFASKYDEVIRTKAKNDFRLRLETALEEINLPPLSENRKFGIDSKKVVLEAILSVYENSIALENRGGGMESLIKTQIALDKTNGLDVVLMEEPENHLSFITLQKMLYEISKRQNDTQIIIATHSNMIASRLNLSNVLWIADKEVISLSCVNKTSADFFMRADNNLFLQLLLSKKVFLVEGATEFLLLPSFYKQVTKRSIEEDSISIISCNGISYKRYLDVVKSTQKKIAVMTDNDGQSAKIAAADEFNKSHSMQQIFMGMKTDDWTWEVCIYKENKHVLDELIPIKDGAQYCFHGENYGPVLGKMLNNKVETAYTMLTSGIEFTIPQYIRDAIEWLNK